MSVLRQLQNAFQGNMIKQHDGFPVDNPARFNAAQCLFKRHFQYVDILTLRFESTAFTGSVFRLVFGEIKIEFFSDGARAHVSFKNFLNAGNAIAGLFFRFCFNPAFRIHVIEQARSSFNKVIFVPVNKDREAELAGQDHRLFIPVIKQDGGSVSPVVNFAILPLPFAIASLQIKGKFFQDVPVIRQCFTFYDAYICTF
ncbi:hypothetical protein EcWSU1_02198 [Enterobacter ludwigii]|uniref:Uncharacterized protein n=1 Tax=Enterobacter ludwigii TaxID=299767 RepID=G8LPH9_9ENTR|nr:hypothetical protein EcWSU1_02198 [Enterobacter ludwigii]